MANETSETMWKVRAEDGTEFGPASMETLLSWARDGRLAPENVISSDGKVWTPVAAHPELAMDWIAEIEPGKFYGPIHQDALRELVRGGQLKKDAPRFARAISMNDSPAKLKEANDSLKAQIDALRRDFAIRSGRLEEDLVSSEAKVVELKTQLETRDLDFEAERQEMLAAGSKMQAELAKAEKKSAALASQIEQSSAAGRTRAVDAARIDELEAKVSELEKNAAANAERLEDALAEARHLKRELDAALQARQTADAKLKALQLREESLRKLLQQATALFSETATGADRDKIVDAEIVTVN